jgi:hypothetical protein
MAELVAILGIAMAAYCTFLVVQPTSGLQWIASMNSERRFALAISLRVAFGILFIVAAPDCSRPQVIRILGLIALAAAAVIAVMGRPRLDGFVEWLAAKPPPFFSVWLATGVAFGLLIVWAAVGAG